MMRLINALLVLGMSAGQVAGLAVFAHFMVTNTLNYTASDWSTDMAAASAAGIDGFALNMAFLDVANDQLTTAFSQANAHGIKLFFSFDYASNGAWNSLTVTNLLNTWKSNTAYYHRGLQPLASTFEGPGNAGDWIAIKKATGCFFVPEWSSLGAQQALQVSPGVPDGLFSWAPWPAGPNDMNTYTDASYMQFLGSASLSTYMMPVSPWFYTNLPGFDKNWLWRGDDLWFNRWNQVLYLTQVQTDFSPPEFVEIISWNDYGESHYIGPLNSKAEYAFNIGKAAFNYADGVAHDAWRLFLPFVIQLAKNGKATVGQQAVMIWYRDAAASACPQFNTVANTASQLQLEYPPEQVVQDKIFYSALLGASAKVTVTVDGVSLNAIWTDVPSSGVGIYHGSVGFNGHTGQVVVTVAGVATVTGTTPIGSSCTDNFENFNAYVYGATGGSSSAVVDITNYVCVEGFGVGDFANICQFTCSLGYCPVTACSCSNVGPQPAMPTPINKDGYPTDGNENFLGLCSFSVNFGYKGTECSTVEPPVFFAPVTSPFFPDTATAGTGLTSTYDKLCQYSCLFGYCPIHSCTVQLVGQLQVPPPILSSPDTTAFLLTLTQEEQDLCIFVCSRSQDACDLDACFLPPLGPTAPPAPPPPTRPSTSAPCIDQSNPIVGDMTCVDSNGGEMSCGECLGLEGSPPANTISGGDFCFIITAVKGGDIDQWNQTACPGDPPPPTYPNGTAVDPSTADSIVNAFCAAAGSDGILGFATWAACYMYSFYGDGDLLDEEMVGITALCDIFTGGLCSAIEDGVVGGSGGGGSG